MHHSTPAEAALAATLIAGVSAETAVEALRCADFDFETAPASLSAVAQRRWAAALSDLPAALDHELAALKELNAWTLDPSHHAWPSGAPAGVLRGVGDRPLYAGGVAIVGARRADGYGRDLAARLARAAVAAGRPVVSGGAFGIDIAAHTAALEAGGRTVVVLGSGLSKPAPATHKAVFQAAAAAGAVVSPFACHQGAGRWTFPKRNPWIATLSETVLVVQASLRSGALQTARAALAAGIPVFAAPGPMDSPLHAGCHQLIDEGARILRAVDAWLPAPLPAQNDTPASPPIGLELWAQTGVEPVPLADLARDAGLDLSVAAMLALQLEMDGWLTSAPGGRYARAR